MFPWKHLRTYCEAGFLIYVRRDLCRGCMRVQAGDKDARCAFGCRSVFPSWTSHGLYRVAMACTDDAIRSGRGGAVTTIMGTLRGGSWKLESM